VPGRIIASEAALMRTKGSILAATSLATVVLTGATCPGGDFADVVYTSGYRPSPGQFVNEPSPFTGLIYNDQLKALGAPIGGGTNAPDNSKVVTLGGFGGSVIVGFTHTVLDDPLNAYGLDAIVFGNSFVIGPISNLAREPGVIEIARDANGNGIPDDPWYVIRAPTEAIGRSGVPLGASLVSRTWDNDPNSATLPDDPAWYPEFALYPWLVPAGFPSSYQTTTFALVMPPSGTALVGHADVSPVLVRGDLDGNNTVDTPGIAPEDFYTVPDNPWVFGVDPGSGGGDAFDIAWAVDPITGDRVNLDGFDFLRVSTGIDADQGSLGEVSTEIGSVSDSRKEPVFFDVDGSGTVDVEDLYAFHRTPVDLTGEGVVTETDERFVMWSVRAEELGDMESGR